MDKLAGNSTPALPVTAADAQARAQSRPRKAARKLLGLGLVSFVLLAVQTRLLLSAPEAVELPLHAQEALDKCRNLHTLPAPPPDFNTRSQSDRFVEGTKAVLIRNATIWTGRVSGLEVVKGDVLLDKGLIKAVGHVPRHLTESFKHLEVHDANGAWVTPGIVDMHSHLGVYSAPALRGASDGNSLHGPVLPWLRSLDGLNTHDDAYRLSVAGGVTTALVLPGSANAIGGQAFSIKLRPTAERSPTSMLLEPPYTINGSVVDPSLPPRWRYMKHACGENPSRVYGNTRMDDIWAMRAGYEKARQIKVKQDDYCDAASKGNWAGLGDFPEDLQWESMVDILRGKVKLNVHCYETVDLNSMILMTQEFKFPIASFHHSHETYLVTEQLKTAWGQTPAAALFAVHARYKRESYRGSEFAPKILSENGIRVVMKVGNGPDHPVLNSRHLIFEAQQAHYYGLPEEVAMSSVTSTPASIMGLDHRIGFLKAGYDADVIVWDSHPLALAATPKQVFIDGVPQLNKPVVVTKPESFQKSPETPSWDKEADETLAYDGLPPLVPRKSHSGHVVFRNVSALYVKDGQGVQESFVANDAGNGVVVVSGGELLCYGNPESCADSYAGLADAEVEFIDLEGGHIIPAVTSFGSALGLSEIQGEPTTQNGAPFDPAFQVVPEIAGGSYALDRAVDGLQYGTRDALLAYLRGGVTTGISAPQGRGLIGGISTSFSTASANKLQKGALLQDEVALHVTVSANFPISVSSQIAILRRLLLTEDAKGQLDAAFKKVAEGDLVLAVAVQSADIMSTLLRLKKEVEDEKDSDIKMTFVGAQEAHLLAAEIAENDVGVIMIPSRPFPGSWENHRILPGPPLSNRSAVGVLLDHGVKIGIGATDPSLARNTLLDVRWAALESDISKKDALAIASSNIEQLLGAEPSLDLVATRGSDDAGFGSKIAGVISVRRGLVDLI